MSVSCEIIISKLFVFGWSLFQKSYTSAAWPSEKRVQTACGFLGGFNQANDGAGNLKRFGMGPNDTWCTVENFRSNVLMVQEIRNA